MHLEREGMLVDRTLLKEVSGIFCQLGEIADPENQLYLYSFLEAGLVEETASYFEQKSAGWVADDTCPEYLSKAEEAFDRETKRIEAYLHSSSEAKILDSFNEKVIVSHLHILLEKPTGIKHLLENHMVDNLLKLFRLCNRVPNTLNPISIELRTFISLRGHDLVNDHESNSRDKKALKDPAFINQLIDLHDRYKDLIA